MEVIGNIGRGGIQTGGGEVCGQAVEGDDEEDDAFSPDCEVALGLDVVGGRRYDSRFLKIMVGRRGCDGRGR